MTKNPSWRAKAMYIMFAFALVFGLAAAVVTAAPASAQTPVPPYQLVAGFGGPGEPNVGLSMNVKTANETFTVVDSLGYPVPPSHVISWAAIEGEGTGEVEIMAGGQPFNNSATVRMVVQGDAIVTCFVDDGAGYTDFLNAEKKWGDITHTELTAPQRDDMEPNDFVLVTEKVYADFLPGPVNAPAGGAKINWWLFENDDADLAQSALEDLLERFGPGNYTYTSGPLGEGEGCGPYSWWGYLGDGTFIPEDNINYLYNTLGYGADYTAFTQAENAGIAPTTNYVTYTDNVNEPLGNGLTNIGVTFSDTGNGEAEPVIVVVLADYPLDKNGENAVCIEYIKFTPQAITSTCQVKTPQLRWAGEKIVLEKEWPVTPGFSMFYDEFGSGQTTMSYDLYAAVYSLEEGDCGNLEAITKFYGFEVMGISDGPPLAMITVGELGLPTGAQQVIQPLGGLSVIDTVMHPAPIVDQASSVSRAILVTEKACEADVNAALYGIHIELYFEGGPHPRLGPLVGYSAVGFGPQLNHGFVTYFMDFEDVVLAEDITPKTTFNNLPVEVDADVAVQVRGFVDYTNTALGPAIDPDTGLKRAELIVDTNNDGIVDKILPEGRWVFPDDWWAMANYNYNFRSNFDLMDSADEDTISSDYNGAMLWWGEEGPYNNAVVTTDPPGLAEVPTIGPFSTLQRWSCDLMWEASSTVPGSWFDRNTVVPDGVMNWYDAPMPQALVTFDVTGYSLPLSDVALTGLWKGDLEGYGYNSATDEYPSPYYLVEVPSSIWIPYAGYEWNSWIFGDGPYEFWGDLMVKSLIDDEPIVENVMDVEVYTDNHGIAALTAVHPDKAGGITITATADFPDRFLKGKYGPLTSGDIEITWGLIEFDPDFEGVPRVCEEVEGCSVEFVNMTDGGVLPYSDAVWDFGDGSLPVHGAINNGQTITHQYTAAGLYSVTLTMWDADSTEAYQVELDYILVGEGGTGSMATWSFDSSGCFPKHLPDTFFDSVQLGSLTGVPSAVQGVYYNDAGTWKFWAPGAPGTTLTTLVGGVYADYLVCVTGATDWVIPLP